MALLTDAFAEVGARGYEYRLLAALEEVGPSSQAVLGRAAELDRSDVVGTIAGLESDAFVERRADVGDGRRKIVSLTPAGRRRLRKLDRVIAAVQEDLLEPLSRREREELMVLLARIGRRGTGIEARSPST